METRLTVILMISAGFILFFAGCSGDKTAETDSTIESVESTEDIIGTWNFTVEIAGESTSEFNNIVALTVGPKEFVAFSEDDRESLHVYTGILLKDILKYYGVGVYSSIDITGADGTKINLQPAHVTSNETGIVWMKDHQVLADNQGPVMLVFSGEPLSQWVSDVIRITIIK